MLTLSRFMHRSERLLFPIVDEAAGGQQEHIQIVHEWSLVVACYKRGPNILVDQTCTVLEQSRKNSTL